MKKISSVKNYNTKNCLTVGSCKTKTQIPSQCTSTCDRCCSYTMKLSPCNSKWSSITTELAAVAKPCALLHTVLCCLEAAWRADTRHFYLLQSRSGAELMVDGSPAPTSQAPGEVTVLYELRETVIVTHCWLPCLWIHKSQLNKQIISFFSSDLSDIFWKG